MVAGNLPVVEFLIDHEQCDVLHADAAGKTPLHYCMDLETPSRNAIAEKLIYSGASPHAKDTQEQTPMTLAIAIDEPFSNKMLQLFIQA